MRWMHLWGVLAIACSSVREGAFDDNVQSGICAYYETCEPSVFDQLWSSPTACIADYRASVGGEDVHVDCELDQNMATACLDGLVDAAASCGELDIVVDELCDEAWICPATPCELVFDHFDDCELGGDWDDIELPVDYCQVGSRERCEADCTLAADCGVFFGTSDGDEYRACINACF